MSDQGFGQERPEYGGVPGQGAGIPGQGAGYPGQGAGYPAQGAGYAAQGAAGYPPPAQERTTAKSFIASLFDFGFTSFVTPKVIKVLYILIMILIGISALGILIFAFEASVIFGIIALIIICPLYFLVYLALWRIALEIFMVIFRIADDLRAIAARGDLR